MAVATPTHTGSRPGIVLFALAMGGFAIGTTEFATMSLLPFMAEGLGIDEATASRLISAYALGVVVGAPLIAVAAARIERRLVLIGLMLMFCLTHILSALAASYPTMLLARFLSGMPHGAYFGVAALMAASLAGPGQRGRAVAKLMLGLTIATVVGVPFANVLGQTVGWRWAFALVGVLSAATAMMILIFAPQTTEGSGSNALQELGALKNRQVLLTLLTGAIGFGGFFAFYTYLASTLIEVTKISDGNIPIYLAIMGGGMTLGALLAGWAADRALNLSVFVMLFANIVLLMLYPVVAGHAYALVALVLAMGIANGLPILLQTRLMTVAGDAQSLAAALHHAAFNAANALGPFVASIYIARGYGFPSSGYVGAALTLAGVLLYAVTLWDQRRNWQGSY
ncbi:MFS transporter [Celeribacter neptunius]|uniref:MFS transporter, DHA1 family, arabinose polymer transporter n=1 Tax=Celeribacter neptunius TaxID=588602 RepID=A0A1I3SBK9_9RHOB|nr:MFS transporter [Celeribacter neptunius]SFJ55009.1 MFS transporter, DHA1 family, arabinose polymer transporter [Celeribacter neptunius]